MFENIKHIQKMINDDEERSIQFSKERSIDCSVRNNCHYSHIELNKYLEIGMHLFS